MSPEYRARVTTYPKPEILDPEGAAIQKALGRLGHAPTEMVRGKFHDLTLTADSVADARSRVQAMVTELLANPVTEEYNISVRTIKPKPSKK